MKTYTREEIELMPAGLLLDGLVAKSMGWKHRSSIGRWLEPSGRMGYFQPPAYSTRMDEAWPVMDKMLDEWPECGLHRGPSEATTTTRVYWGFDGHGWTWVDAETAPLAICRAALIASLT